MRCRSKTLLFWAALLAAPCMNASVQASVINVDFNAGASPTSVGLAAAPDALGGATAVWNNTSGGSPTVTDAVDSTGGLTTVDVTVNSRGAFNGPVDQELANTSTTNLFTDYLSSRADDNGADLRTGSISGLIAGNSYDLYIYGQGDNFTDTNFNGGQNVGIRIGSDVRHTSHDGTSGGDGQLVEDIEYVLFSGILADSTGTISFEHFNPGTGIHGTDSSFFDSSTGSVDADGNNSRFSAINGLQIVGEFVPEPSSSSLTLLSLAGLCFLARRRR